MNIEQLTGEIINACTYGAGIAIIIALCEWVVGFFYRAITDKLRGGRNV